MKSLEPIIERAYQIFKKYKFPQDFKVCDCCVSKQELRQLHICSIKDIEAEVLSSYNHAAQPHSTIQELKYFLPRFLELTAQFDFPTHSTEYALQRIGHYDATLWTEEEANLLNEFRTVFFKQSLKIYPLFRQSIGAIVMMLYNANMDINQMLKMWEQANSIESTLHFSDLVNKEINQSSFRIKLQNAFSERAVDDALDKWLDNPKIKKRFQNKIEKIIFSPKNLSEEYLTQLSWAYDKLI